MLLPEIIYDIKNTVISSLKKYFLCFVSAIFLILSFAPFDLFPLAWIAFLPFFYFLYNASDHKTVAKGGLVFGLLYFFGNVYWIYHSLYYYGSVPLAFSFFIVILLSFYLALYIMVFALLYKNLIKTNLPTCFYAPFIWISLEVLRNYLLTGFPWALIGYSQYKFLLISQIADITGIYGVSFLVVLFNCFVFDILIFKRQKTNFPLLPYYPIITSTITIIVIFIFCISYGFKKLNETDNEHSVKVAIVQGNIPQNVKWDNKKILEIIDIYKNLTLKAKAFEPNLIVWPETAVPFVFDRHKTYTNDLIHFVKNENIYLLFGTIMEREPDKFTNSSVLIDSNGVIAYYYDKIHLVPFGEYVPLRKILFFVDKLTFGVGDYKAGENYNVAVTPFGKFSTLICYESIFPSQVRKFYQKGGNFIVNITNDGWFGNTSGPYQHFSMAVFRAIENRKPLVRAANSGISGYIDSKGRIVKKTKLFERTFLVEDIFVNEKMSFYTKYGDIFAYICIVVSLIFVLWNLSIGGKKWLHVKI